jgi:hypothetical protein
MKAMKKKEKRAHRDTKSKRIVSLAKEGKISEAFKQARGFSISESDAASRLVDLWQAVQDLKANPELARPAPNGFEKQLEQKAERLTFYCVSAAIVNGDADFFLKVAKRLKASPPSEDKLRLLVLRDKLAGKETNAKELAFKLGGKNIISDAEQIRRFQRNIAGKDK